MKTIEAQQNCSLSDIRHQGIVKNIDEHQIYVSIISQSACVSCQVKGVCNVSEISEEIIEVPRKQGIEYNIGDRVHVAMQKSLGTRAVILGYVLPFLLLLLTLIVAMAATNREGLSGLLALGILIPYYLILYRMKNRLKKTFTFRIESF